NTIAKGSATNIDAMWLSCSPAPRSTAVFSTRRSSALDYANSGSPVSPPSGSLGLRLDHRSHQLKARKILRIDDTDGTAFSIEHHEVIDALAFEDVQHFDREFIRADGDWIPGHEFAHGFLQQIGPRLEMPPEVA